MQKLNSGSCICQCSYKHKYANDYVNKDKARGVYIKIINYSMQTITGLSEISRYIVTVWNIWPSGFWSIEEVNALLWVAQPILRHKCYFSIPFILLPFTDLIWII